MSDLFLIFGIQVILLVYIDFYILLDPCLFYGEMVDSQICGSENSIEFVSYF